jgi:hypothetical protein
MIAYDLECANGHRFEGWFDSLESFELQNADGMICCPYCDDSSIHRVFSPVAVKRGVQAPSPDSPVSRMDYQRLAVEVLRYIRDNSEDVGPRFAAEALKIHYGAAEKRSIRGYATEHEEETLKSEGVDFVKVPFPKNDDEPVN